MKVKSRLPEVPGKSSFALKRWFSKLYEAGLLFNPDDRPEEIVSIETGEQTFTPEECVILNKSLQILFEQHGDRVREVALNYFHKAMGIQVELSQA